MNGFESFGALVPEGFDGLKGAALASCPSCGGGVGALPLLHLCDSF